MSSLDSSTPSSRLRNSSQTLPTSLFPLICMIDNGSRLIRFLTATNERERERDPSAPDLIWFDANLIPLIPPHLIPLAPLPLIVAASGINRNCSGRGGDDDDN